jgi:anthranilate phosphoribosyltransferase
MAHSGSQDKREAVQRAAKSIDSGAALQKVNQLASFKT